MRRKAVLLTWIGALAVVVAASAAGLPTRSAEGAGETRYLVLMLVYAGAALVFSFLCSVAEAVLLSVSPSFIAFLRQQGKPLADRLQQIKSNIDRSLAAILTLNTIAHTVGAGGAGAEAAAYFGRRRLLAQTRRADSRVRESPHRDSLSADLGVGAAHQADHAWQVHSSLQP